MPVSLIAHTSAAGAGIGPITTPPIDTTGATLLVAWVTTGDIPFGVLGLQDSQSNVWSQLPTQRVPGDVRGTLWYVFTPLTAVGQTFTTTSTWSNINPSICVVAFSGVYSLDQANGANITASGVPTFQPGSVTPDVNGELLIAGIGWSQSNTLAIDSGFSITDQVNWSLGNSYGSALAYLVQAVAAPIDPTWTATGSGMTNPVASIGSMSPVPPQALVSQSAVELITLSNPNAQVSQSAVEVITVPAVYVEVILRGVKRVKAPRPDEICDAPASPPVKRAV